MHHEIIVLAWSSNNCTKYGIPTVSTSSLLTVIYSSLWLELLTPLSGGLFACVHFALLMFPLRRSVFAESPSGNPGICASKVPLPFVPFVYAFWWLQLTPHGCSVFVL